MNREQYKPPPACHFMLSTFCRLQQRGNPERRIGVSTPILGATTTS